MPWVTTLGNINLNFRLARDQIVHLETEANLCANRPDLKRMDRHWNKATLLTRDIIPYSWKGIIIAKTYQINKKEI